MNSLTDAPVGPAGRPAGLAGFAAAISLAALSMAACGRDDGPPGGGAGTGAASGGGEEPPVLESGIALAFVYDTSGSMADSVTDGSGGRSPKWQIANRTFLSIVDRLEKFTAAPPSGEPLRLDTMVVRFRARNDSTNAKAEVALPLAPFSAQAMRGWIGGFSRPDGPTPLGDAVRIAGRAVLDSKLVTKHVLVLTDGKNTHPPLPADVLRDLRTDAERRGVVLEAHFVAFDIAAAEFAPVKTAGASVFSAADENELRDRMQNILEEKILLEVAGPRGAGTGTK